MKYSGGGLAQYIWRVLSLCCAWSVVGLTLRNFPSQGCVGLLAGTKWSWMWLVQC